VEIADLIKDQGFSLFRYCPLYLAARIFYACRKNLLKFRPEKFETVFHTESASNVFGPHYAGEI